MARVTAHYTFADGETIHFTATGKRSYPDSMAELRATVVKGLHDTLADIRAFQTPVEVEDAS